MSGNIISRKVCELNRYNVIADSKFKYNDVNWNDKLTKFNDKIICYDAIGNPVDIGNSIHMTWKNGRELSQYVDQNNSINYEYNKDGIRLSKIINGVKTEYAIKKYYLKKISNNVIYYIHDDEVDLKVQIYDRYDFDLEIKSYGSGGIKWIIFTTGNNLAYLDQLTGAINNYNIYVDIDYKYCLVK